MHAWAGVMPSNVMNEGVRIYKEAQKNVVDDFYWTMEIMF